MDLITKTKESLTAEEYKSSLLPDGRKKVFWTIETFSVYVNLLYPHVSVVPGQEWTGVLSKYRLLCEKPGEFEARAKNVLNE